LDWRQTTESHGLLGCNIVFKFQDIRNDLFKLKARNDANMSKAKAQFYKIVKAGRKQTYNTSVSGQMNRHLLKSISEQFSPERRKLISRCFI
jgi:hypothetical protein